MSLSKIFLLLMPLFSTFFLFSRCSWQNRAVKDLENIYNQAFQESQALEAKQHKTTINNYYRIAQEKAHYCYTQADYQAVISYFKTHVNGSIDFESYPKKVWWPGFLVSYNHGVYSVSHCLPTGDKCLNIEYPPIGAQLLAVDGMPVNEYIKAFIKPFSCNKTDQQQALSLFINDGSLWTMPIRSCFFLVNGSQIMIPIYYRRVNRRFLTCLISPEELVPSKKLLDVICNSQ